ncbi:Nucleoporin nup184 [Sphaceloma murrayae]|uniref:Nucleoporin nup184 n=1 Tax=Sphaceloma murrayae TaxID=2082308 RepID=A0A2K1QYF6_9PEZI|nr:Nucleoporin nup184 [Sphaceloma murrayae]
MKLSSPLALAITAYTPAAYAQGSFEDWRAPGIGDVRSPCPMLNTLANHGFLPRNGLNITREVAIKGFSDALNFDPSFGMLLWQQGLVANPIPNATFWTLGNLQTHDLLEHDGSLSRQDQFFGNSTNFNERVWESTLQYLNTEILTMPMLGNARTARKLHSKAFNPTYRFTPTAEQFSGGEVVTFPLVFGNIEQETINRTQLDFFFRNERLPLEVGWQRSPVPIGLPEVRKLTRSLLASESLITDAQGNLLGNLTCSRRGNEAEDGSSSARRKARGLTGRTVNTGHWGKIEI